MRHRNGNSEGECCSAHNDSANEELLVHRSADEAVIGVEVVVNVICELRYLPSALPALLVFHAAQKRSLQPGVLLRRSALFACAYLVVWAGWSLAASLAQGVLQERALLAPDQAVMAPRLAAVILLVAGLYQFTPWKRACLDHCRSPQDFLVLNWRNGGWGALQLGTRHGAFCVGCCWALMLLLFVVGIMNVAWVALLAGVVLVEKAMPGGIWLSRAAGVILVAWAGWLAYSSFAL